MPSVISQAVTRTNHPVCVVYRFPPEEHPVLALKGAPAAFPVKKTNRVLQRYLVWNSQMRGWVEDYVQREMSGEPYIAVHLRIGSDWVRTTSGVLVWLHIHKATLLLDATVAIVVQ